MSISTDAAKIRAFMNALDVAADLDSNSINNIKQELIDLEQHLAMMKGEDKPEGKVNLNELP